MRHACKGEQLLATVPDYAPNRITLLGLTTNQATVLGYAGRDYELSPKRPEIADTLGWILIRQGDKAAAMPLLSQAFEAAPDNPAIGYHYAWALSKGGKMAQASEIIGKVLKSPDAFAERKDAEQLGATLKTQ